MKKTRYSIWTIVLFVLTPLLFLLFMSRNSPLHNMNTREDINCFLACGQYILNGKIPYRDFFDHKGPIVYYLYAFCLLLWPKTFHGVYILEVVSGIAFCFISRKTISLFVKSKSLPTITTILVYISSVFTANGDNGQFEQFCLPLLAYAIYLVAKYMKNKTLIKKSAFLMVGLCAGFIFWGKFTILVVYMICIVALVIVSILDKAYDQIRDMVIYGVIGFAIITAVVIVFFASVGALDDLISVYFIANSMQYTSNVMMYPDHKYLSIAVSSVLGIILYTFGMSYAILLLVVASNMKAHKDKRIHAIVGFAAMGYGLTVIGACIGGYAFSYYFINVTSWYPIIFAIYFEYRKFLKGFLSKFAIITSCILFGAYGCAYASYFFEDTIERNEYEEFQKEAVDMMKETGHTNMCCLNFLEDGFYYQMGELPDRYYFTAASARRREIVDSMMDGVYSGDIDYVFVHIPVYTDREIPYIEEIVSEAPLVEVDRFEYDDGAVIYMYENLNANH